jgi:transposase
LIFCDCAVKVFHFFKWILKLFTDRSSFKLNKKNNDDIYIGKRTLEQHLLEADICQPFYIKELLSKQDWSIFENKHQNKGRKPYKPQLMVGLIFYGLMQGISSLRDLERLARVDLGCLLITGGIFPDFSSIGYFIRRHQDILIDEFFINLTKAILKITRSGVRELAGDGTIIEAAASRYRLMRQELVEKNYEELKTKSSAHPEDQKLAAATEKMEQASKIIQTRIDKRKAQHKSIETVTINPIEPEAVVQPTKKGKNSVPAYKPSVLANEARIVVAIDVHPSNEIESLMSMLDKTSQLDGEVKELLLDGGYESIEVLEESIKRDISVLCTSGGKSKKSAHHAAKHQIKKSDFTYDERTDSYTCPQGQQLTPLRKGKATATTPAYQTYSTKACSECPIKNRCTTSNKGRQLKRFEGDELKEALKIVMEQPQAQKKLRQRKAMVEPVFSHLRMRQNFNRFKRKGLKKVKVEFALQIMAYNISRAIARYFLFKYIKVIIISLR